MLPGRGGETFWSRKHVLPRLCEKDILIWLDRFQCDALDEALNIAIMTRLISKSFNIVSGHEALGLGPIADPSSPLHGRIPIPPMLDAQMDSILMDFMKTRQRHGLSKLKTLMMSHSKENWFMIFLTMIVLLPNLEFLYEHQREQKERYGTTVRPIVDHVSWRANDKYF